MNHPSSTRLSPWLRLVFGLALLLGLCAVTGGLARPAHAASAITVSTCDESHLDAAISQANSDNAGDTITFGCSGDITLSSTLTISGSMTLDGSGQNVTLDGQNKVTVLNVNGVTFTLNALTIAHGLGGAANNGGTVTISNSTFAYNSTPTTSIIGGLYNINGTATISNSTFANNSDGYGGGLSDFNGKVTISNSTFAYNSAIYGGGVYLDNSATLNISGSIVAENSSPYGVTNCYPGFLSSINDRGYNLENGTDCGFTGTGSKQNTNPQLAALANNGGPTQTMALQQGSPAIDAVATSSNLCPSTDQRGDPRPDNPSETACDMGAYEFNDPPDHDLALTNVPANITVDATSSQGAVVTYTPPTATDESGDTTTASVSCDHASGSTFPIGTTTVTCTATDSDDTNSPVSASFSVTVNDSDLALSNMPSNISANATSPSGATVNYTPPTAVDEDAATPSVTCDHASGSTFSIGTTTVTCTATDSDDGNSPVMQSFTVTVNPVLAASGTSVSATEGHSFSGVVATGTAYGSGAVSASIDWGDGNTSAGSVTLNPDGSYSVTGSHTYAEEGTFAITVTVSASGASNAMANSSATVSDAALSANTPTAVIGKKGNVTLSTVFSDADPGGIVSDYSATITWGDGSTSTGTISTSGTSFTATGSHSYAKHKTYTVTVTIKDAGGSSVTKTLTIRV